MKKLLTLIAATLFLGFGFQNSHAQDGFFSNAKTLEKGTFAIGLQPVALTAQDDFLMIFRASYGLSNGITSHFKFGTFQEETYIGGHLEFNLTSEPNAGISTALLAGIYSQGETGLKFGLNLSRDFHPVSLYGGLNYQPLFINDEVTLNSFLLPIGLDYHIQNAPVDLMLEANIPLNDDAEYLEAITFGARIYLN